MNNDELSPMIREFQVSELLTQVAYQREFDGTFAKRIQRDFDGRAIGVLVVNVREDGTVAVIDGQHRLYVAKQQGYKSVTCEVYQGLDEKEEAHIFDLRNMQRRYVSASDRFRARLVSGDEAALEIEEIAHSCGLSVGKRPLRHEYGRPTVSAVDTLEWLYRVGGGIGLSWTLKFLTKTWPNDPTALRHDFLSGTWTFWRAYNDRIDEDKLSAALSKVSIDTVNSQIKKLRIMGTRSPRLATAESFLAVYNQKTRAKLPNLLVAG